MEIATFCHLILTSSGFFYSVDKVNLSKNCETSWKDQDGHVLAYPLSTAKHPLVVDHHPRNLTLSQCLNGIKFVMKCSELDEEVIYFNVTNSTTPSPDTNVSTTKLCVDDNCEPTNFLDTWHVVVPVVLFSLVLVFGVLVCLWCVLTKKVKKWTGSFYSSTPRVQLIGVVTLPLLSDGTPHTDNGHY